MAYKKVMFTIPEELLNEVDEEVKKHYTNRSAYILSALRYYMQTSTAVESALKMSSALDEFAKANPPADDYTQGQFDMLKKMLEGTKENIKI
jgi:metal-responsive CopG/Arc/MetJ family transcriptional regulator